MIKTIVFGDIYRNQEQNTVFNILNEIEEDDKEYTYIDVVVTTDDISDFDTFKQIFGSDHDHNHEMLARDLFELVNAEKSAQIDTKAFTESADVKNNSLLEFNWITPIVDDFLRYHRDSERLDVESEKNFTLPVKTGSNNAKNIQLALLYQQRKKKENTKAQLVVNKIDAISDYYSENVTKDENKKKDLKKFFHEHYLIVRQFYITISMKFVL